MVPSTLGLSFHPTQAALAAWLHTNKQPAVAALQHTPADHTDQCRQEGVTRPQRVTVWSRQTDQQVMGPSCTSTLHLKRVLSFHSNSMKIECEWTFAFVILSLPFPPCACAFDDLSSSKVELRAGQAALAAWLHNNNQPAVAVLRRTPGDHTDQCRKEGMTRPSLSTASDSLGRRGLQGKSPSGGWLLSLSRVIPSPTARVGQS